MADYYSLSLPVSRGRWLDAPSPLVVVPGSPLAARRAVETLAHYFRREMHFDFVQFDATETPASPGFAPYEAWLFHELAHDRLTEAQPSPRRVFGACCFRWKEWRDHDPGWSMHWAWLHPYFRRRGHLADAWPLFQQRYAEGFHVERPLSVQMQAFLDADPARRGGTF